MVKTPKTAGGTASGSSAGAGARRGKAAKAPVDAPLAAGGLHPLPLATPAGLAPGALGSGALAVFRGRLVLAAGGALHAAAPDARGWEPLFATPWRMLTPNVAETAEKLGFVEDGAAAAAMGVQVPQDYALGPLVAFQGRGERKESLYCGTSSLWGGRLLRATGPGRFAEAPLAGIARERRGEALTALAAAGDWLLAAPGPVLHLTERRRAPLFSDRPARVFGSRTPGVGHWQEVALPGFGAGVAGGVTALAFAHGHAYAAVAGPDRGFELWRAAPRDEVPWDWTRVIDRGGHRYSHAPVVTATAVLGDHLYLAAGISESGFGKDHAGPAAAELLRVAPDGGWELLVGRPRFSPDGLKVPLSGLGPGFGDGFNTLVQSLVAWRGALYAGTRNARADYDLRKGAAELAGGAALWVSADGVDWAPVVENGAGNPAMTAIPALAGDEAAFYAAGLTDLAMLAAAAGMAAEEAGGLELEIWRGG